MVVMNVPMLLTAVAALALSDATPVCDRPVRLWVQGSVIRMLLELACSWSTSVLPPDVPYNRSTFTGFFASIR